MLILYPELSEPNLGEKFVLKMSSRQKNVLGDCFPWTSAQESQIQQKLLLVHANTPNSNYSEYLLPQLARHIMQAPNHDTQKNTLA